MALAKFRKDLSLLNETDSVAAVFTLNVPQSEGPDAISSMVKTIVEQAEQDCNVKVRRLSIKARLRSFSIDAPAALLDRLAEHKLIYGAMLNQADESLHIRGTVPPRNRSKDPELASGSQRTKPSPARPKRAAPSLER